MTPIVTPSEMAAIDAAAPEPLDVLIERAGAAVAREALAMLGGSYGRVVNVVVGTGNNGADGRVAARRLADRGVLVRVLEASTCPPVLPSADLVIDAAFGTGFRGSWTPPAVGDAAVLAVDVPSGLDATTGVAGTGVLRADRTVTFQALKPGLLLGDGPSLSGRVVVADIGLDVGGATRQRVEAADVGRWWPRRATDAHKWRAAVLTVAGSASMPGAARLATSASLRSGAGIVSLFTPRASTASAVAADPEVVVHVHQPDALAEAALTDLARFGAMVVGPGLGRDDLVLAAARRCIAETTVPVVIDGDAIFAVGGSPGGPASALRRLRTPAVVTPHDGEFGHLVGAPPGADRIAAVRSAAAQLGAVVLLKGPTTVVAAPPGVDTPEPTTWVIDAGDQRLATPGSGDVLSGMIGAALAAGLRADLAAAGAAHLHAMAARSGPAEGLVARDLIAALPDALHTCREAAA